MSDHTRNQGHTPRWLFRLGLIATLAVMASLLITSSPSRAAGNGTITGTLTRADGVTPVTSTSLGLHTANWSYSWYANTASNGTFTFSDIPPGTYAFEVNWANSSDGIKPDNQTITVMADQTTALGTVRLLTPNFFCKVTRSDGITPIANASVTIRTADWSISRYASTASDGTCQLAVQQATDYVIEVYTSDAQESRPDNITFTYTSGSVYYDGTHSSTVIKTIPAAIQGKVVLPNGQPAQYTNLMLADSSGNSVQSASTDINGLFKIDAVATGTYTLRVNPPSTPTGLAAPDTISLSLTKGTTNTTYVGAPITLLNAVKTISGRVTRSSTGAAIANGSLSFWQMNGGSGTNAQTDSNGYFSVLVGGSGTWQVSLYPMYSGNTTPDWTYGGTPKSVTFALPAAQAETQTADFAVATLSATLTGHVYLPNGNPATSNSYWINAWGQNMSGNGGQVQSDGTYNLRLAPGTYNVSLNGSSSDYGAAEQTVTLTDNQTLTLDITLLNRNAHITGTIRGTDGRALTNQSCSAWTRRGSGWGWASTDSNGSYTMNVMPGTYLVSCYSTGTYSGASLVSILSTNTSYVSTDPPQEVTVAANGTTTADFTFALADATINIRLTDTNGTTISTMWGWAEARKCSTSTSAFHYGGLGASLSNGSGSLRIPAGCWIISASVPYGADYSASSTTSQQVTITSGETQNVTLTLVPNNAVVNGSFRDTDGNVLTSVYGSVFLSNAGNSSWQWAPVNAGTFSIRTAAGTWDLGCWVDPSTAAQYYLAGTCDTQVTTTANATTTHDITLRVADSTITVRTHKPDGTVLPNALIRVATSFGSVKTVSYDTYGSWFRPETITDQNGLATVRVPAGTYFVSTSLDTDLGYINPPRQAVTASADTPADVTLTFLRPDATITGTVTRSATAYTGGALVTATNTDGGYSQAEVGSTGTYSLPVTGGDTWIVQAGADDSETIGLESAETSVEVPANGTATANLTLDTNTTLPAGVTTTFSTANQQSITQPDGATITIPQNSLTTQSTTVSFSVTATVEQAPETATDNRVGPGYAIEAVPTSGQNAGQALTQLAGSVTVCLPYTDAELTADRLQESDLTMKAWDDTASTYTDLQSVVVNETANQVCATTNHFTTFAITAAPVETQRSAPVITPDLVELSNHDLAVLTGTRGPLITVYKPDGKIRVRFHPYGKVTTGTFRLTAADVTGDGAEELITWEATGKNVPVKAFSTAGKRVAALKAPRVAVTIVASDVSGDGSAEIIVAGTKSRATTIYTRHGTAFKRLVQISPRWSGGSEVSIGNLTGSTTPEIVLLDRQSSRVAVYGINATRKRIALLAQSNNLAVPASGNRLTLADIRGDAYLELIAWPGTTGAKVRALGFKGKKLVTLATATVTKPIAFTTGELTNDSKTDVVALTQVSGGIALKLLSFQTGATATAASVEKTIGQTTIRNPGLAVGDFDANGTSDVIVTQGNSTRVLAYTYQTGSRTLKKLTSGYIGTRSNRYGYTIQAIDLNGDGLRELILTPTAISPTIRIIKLSGKKFVAQQQLQPGGKSYQGSFNVTTASMTQ